MSQETYSVAALAAAVGVPRTTINDWLSRYADYIDCTAVGKRKVYSAASLSVLKEIAVMRDSGKSSAEIETLLAQKHGVRPEVTPPPEVKSDAEKAPGTAPDAENASTALAIADHGENSQLPALKNIEQSAMELAGFIAEMQKTHVQTVKRAKHLALTMLSGIVVLLIAVVLIYAAMRSEAAGRRSDAEQARQDLLKLSGELQNEAAGRRSDAEQARQDLLKLSGELQNEAAGRRSDAEKSQQAARAMQTRLDTLNSELKNMQQLRENERKQAELKREQLQKELEQLKKEYAQQSEQLKKELEQVRLEREKARQGEALARQESESQKKRADQQQKIIDENAEKSRRMLESMQQNFDRKLQAIDKQLEALKLAPAPAPAAPEQDKTDQSKTVPSPEAGK